MGVIFGKGAPFEADRLESACATACAADGAERFKGVFFVRTRGWVLGGGCATAGPRTRTSRRGRRTRAFRSSCGDEPAPVAVAALESAFAGAQSRVRQRYFACRFRVSRRRRLGFCRSCGLLNHRRTHCFRTVFSATRVDFKLRRLAKRLFLYPALSSQHQSAVKKTPSTRCGASSGVC